MTTPRAYTLCLNRLKILNAGIDKIAKLGKIILGGQDCGILEQKEK